MTKREQLYFDYLMAYNAQFVMKGLPERQINVNEFSQSRKFRCKAAHLTIAKLNTMIAAVQAEVKRYEAKQQLAIWLESEEGKQYVAVRKERMEEICKQRHVKMDEVQEYARRVVRDLLGEQWDVTYFDEYSIEIAIIEKYTDEGCPRALFGHGFTVYFEKKWCIKDGKVQKDKYRWELNYDCMGGFDLNANNNDNSRVNFLVGLAKFASNTVEVNELHDRIFKMIDELDTLNNKYRELKKELDHLAMEVDAIMVASL